MQGFCSIYGLNVASKWTPYEGKKSKQQQLDTYSQCLKEREILTVFEIINTTNNHQNHKGLLSIYVIFVYMLWNIIPTALKLNELFKFIQNLIDGWLDIDKRSRSERERDYFLYKKHHVLIHLSHTKIKISFITSI